MTTPGAEKPSPYKYLVEDGLMLDIAVSSPQLWSLILQIDVMCISLMTRTDGVSTFCIVDYSALSSFFENGLGIHAVFPQTTGIC